MSRQAGFTLAELAIVMLVFSILLGGMFVSISTQLDLRSISDTQRSMEQAREALIGFAVARGYLPCPASATNMNANTPTGNGSETARFGGNCTVFDGYVPAVTLSITPTDAQGFLIDSYGTRIRYAVTRDTIGADYPFTTTNFASQIKQVGIAALNPNLAVCSTSAGITVSDCSGASTRLTNSAVAVIYSLGKNARSATGGTGADESKNLDANRSFVSHDITDSAAANGEFDDLLTWLSPNILYNRLIAAGAI
ncbi:MAG: type II secretion system protein [Betaproteobacteria bacterium]|nr:type II secretion system protein [Betaproteobacteria bacterium]